MDAVRFIKEKNRMCIAHLNPIISCCHICPIGKEIINTKHCNNSADIYPSTTCKSFIDNNTEEAVRIVEQWSKDNPREIDWMKVPVGTPVQVKNFSNTSWNPATYEFALYLPNAPHMFGILNDNRERATMTLWYDFCKLADDVDPTPYYKD